MQDYAASYECILIILLEGWINKWLYSDSDSDLGFICALFLGYF